MMNHHDCAQNIAKILTNIKNHLDDIDRSKLLRECERLGSYVGKCFMSAMTVYRLRKISGLSKLSLSGSANDLKTEITELIEILTNIVSWRCGICGKNVDAENESHLELWIHAHKMISDHK
jgi:hypothetical protein